MAPQTRVKRLIDKDKAGKTRTVRERNKKLVEDVQRYCEDKARVLRSTHTPQSCVPVPRRFGVVSGLWVAVELTACPCPCPLLPTPPPSPQDTCRRKLLLEHFNEKFTSAQCRYKCDTCRAGQGIAPSAGATFVD